MAFKVPEDRRITEGLGASTKQFGNNGAFSLARKLNRYLFCIASDGLDWEHVSVSLPHMVTPSWDDMCFVKDAFWDKEDCVVQFHPPEAEYVNTHKGCLHLWRKKGVNWETPPKELV